MKEPIPAAAAFHPFQTLGPLLLLIGATLSFPSRSLAQEDHRVGIRHATEIEFEAEPGHAYRLQRSTNLLDWVDVGESVYGHGHREDRLFSTRQDDHGIQSYFRVLVTEASTNGFAPWNLAGFTLNLDDRPGGDAMQFLTETNGIDAGLSVDPFAYAYARQGTNEARAEITYAPDRYDILTLTFATPTLGTWVRDEFRKGRLKDRDVGAFRVTAAPDGVINPPDGSGTNPPVVIPTQVPGALTGLAYVFQSGESPERLEFLSATIGREFSDDNLGGDGSLFTYAYSLNSTNAATLRVDLEADRWDEYDLTFVSGAQGSFVRREFVGGTLVDTDTGAFSATGSTTVTQPSGSMPAGPSLAGLRYTLDDGGAIPEQPTFETDSTGMNQDDSGPSSFTYTYTVTGTNSAQLVLRFAPDKWNEYDLLFTEGTNSGSFVRRRYDKNAIKSTTSGLFSGAQMTP